MSENTFRIIEAADTPMGIGSGDLALTIAWPDGEETVEHVSERAAAALGYQRPEEPAAPPAWVVEMAREGVAQTNERRGSVCDHGFARSVRAGTKDGHPEVKAAIATLRLALERRHVVEAREALTESFVSEDDPLFNPIWDVIKGWDIGDLAKYGGYCGSTGDHVRSIIRAVRAVAAPAAPSVDLEALAKRAWDAGWISVEYAIQAVRQGGVSRSRDDVQADDVARLLSTLPTPEA